MRLLLIGYGRMGKAVDRLSESYGCSVAGRLDVDDNAGGSGITAAAVDGVVVARVDDVGRDGLRDLAASIRDIDGVRAVVLGTALDSGGAALAAAAATGSGLHAGDLITDAKKTIGGGGKPAADLCVAGGRDAGRLDEALDLARAAAGIG